eukprot:scaffold11667_cov127-Isochrysis_galbana.AAC.1
MRPREPRAAAAAPTRFAQTATRVWDRPRLGDIFRGASAEHVPQPAWRRSATGQRDTPRPCDVERVRAVLPSREAMEPAAVASTGSLGEHTTACRSDVQAPAGIEHVLADAGSCAMRLSPCAASSGAGLIPADLWLAPPMLPPERAWYRTCGPQIATSGEACEQPGACESPGAPCEDPAAREHPAAREQPSAREYPAAREQPSAREHPAAREQPSAREYPAAREQPSAREHPAAREHPRVYCLYRALASWRCAVFGAALSRPPREPAEAREAAAAAVAAAAEEEEEERRRLGPAAAAMRRERREADARRLVAAATVAAAATGALACATDAGKARHVSRQGIGGWEEDSAGHSVDGSGGQESTAVEPGDDREGGDGEADVVAERWGQCVLLLRWMRSHGAACERMRSVRRWQLLYYSCAPPAGRGGYSGASPHPWRGSGLGYSGVSPPTLGATGPTTGDSVSAPDPARVEAGSHPNWGKAWSLPLPRPGPEAPCPGAPLPRYSPGARRSLPPLPSSSWQAACLTRASASWREWRLYRSLAHTALEEGVRTDNYRVQAHCWGEWRAA